MLFITNKESNNSSHVTVVATILLTCAASFVIGTVLGIGGLKIVLYDRNKKENENEKSNNKQHNNNKSSNQQYDHVYYLNKIQCIRKEMIKPKHSGFRVVALLLLEDNNTEIIGINIEYSTCISGSICAERSALIQYNYQYMTSNKPKINTIYIVSDHPTLAIPPGCLCREYMYGCTSIDPIHTLIILQSANTDNNSSQKCNYVIRTLNELYPYPSPIRHCNNVQESMSVLHNLSLNNDKQNTSVLFLNSINDLPKELIKILPSITKQDVQTLIYKAAKTAITNATMYNNVYPIQYGAAALILDNDNNNNEKKKEQQQRYNNNIIIETSYQKPALEYGCTQDAICQLLAKLEKDNNNKKNQRSILLLVQVATICYNKNEDYGGSNSGNDNNNNDDDDEIITDYDDIVIVPHSPFAQARSILIEHGYGQCWVVLYNDNDHRIHFVQASELAPYIPEIVCDS